MKLRILWDDLKTSLWFRPAVWLIGLGLLGFVMIAVDQFARERGLLDRPTWIYLEGVDEARIILGAIGSASVTVAALAFSILMVAVVQTANAYSPRILRAYLADTNNQHVLGMLLGTFVYSLVVLGAANATEEIQFIPVFSVAGALVLAVLSIIAFIYFINHVAHSIEVSSVLHRVYDEARVLLDELYPGRMGQPWTGAEPPPLPSEIPAMVPSRFGGYVEAIAQDTLVKAAAEWEAIIQLEHQVGDFVLPGTRLASVWPASAAEALGEVINSAVTLGRERTMVQDAAYGIRQISDMALRAISPAVNDPSTAVNCIDVMGLLLVRIMELTPVSPYRCDEDGALRVIAPGLTFESALDLSFGQVRQYGSRDMACTTRIIEICGNIGSIASRPEHRAALWRQIAMMARSADRYIHEPFDRAAIDACLIEAAQAVGENIEQLRPSTRVYS